MQESKLTKKSTLKSKKDLMSIKSIVKKCGKKILNKPNSTRNLLNMRKKLRIRDVRENALRRNNN